MALGILDNLLVNNDRFTQIWATKIDVLNYLAHGYWAYGNAMSATPNVEEAQSAIRQSKIFAKALLQTTELATKKFPEDKWFKFEHQMAKQEFQNFVE